MSWQIADVTKCEDPGVGKETHAERFRRFYPDHFSLHPSRKAQSRPGDLGETPDWTSSSRRVSNILTHSENSTKTRSSWKAGGGDQLSPPPWRAWISSLLLACLTLTDWFCERVGYTKAGSIQALALRPSIQSAKVPKAVVGLQLVSDGMMDETSSCRREIGGDLDDCRPSKSDQSMLWRLE